MKPVSSAGKKGQRELAQIFWEGPRCFGPAGAVSLGVTPDDLTASGRSNGGADQFRGGSINDVIGSAEELGGCGRAVGALGESRGGKQELVEQKDRQAKTDAANDLHAPRVAFGKYAVESAHGSAVGEVSRDAGESFGPRPEINTGMASEFTGSGLGRVGAAVIGSLMLIVRKPVKHWSGLEVGTARSVGGGGPEALEGEHGGGGGDTSEQAGNDSPREAWFGHASWMHRRGSQWCAQRANPEPQSPQKMNLVVERRKTQPLIIKES